MKAVIFLWLLTSLGVGHSASVVNQNFKERDVAAPNETDVSKNSLSNETCNQEDTKCAYGSVCELQDGQYFCYCKEGLAGDRCETIVDCMKGGKYERCSEVDGKCEFREGKAVCVCKDEKEFDVMWQICRATCNNDEQCSFGAKCVQLEHGFCSCPVGLTGDMCEIIVECQPGGKFEKCTQGRGSCKFYAGKALCECGLGEEFDVATGQCREIRITTGDEESSTEGTIATTIINPDCDCGMKSYKCIRGSGVDKKCICYAGYAQVNGMCSECNCGENSKLCYFDRSSKKACICSDGYAQRNGTCTGICLKNSDCRNGGACRIGEDGAPFCACRRPFAGEWCESHSACAGLNCEAAGAECRVRGVRAQCECPSWSWYNADFRRCEGYSKLWIVSVALFSASALQMIFFLCYCCVCRRKEKK